MKRLTPEQIANLCSGIYLKDYPNLEGYDLAVANAVQDTIFGPETAIVSIEVMPVIRMGGGGVIAQPDGPTRETTHWTVYLRGADGVLRHYANGCEASAAEIGQMLMARLGVEIEPQPWRKA